MVLINRRYEQAVTWQDELPLLVRRRIIEEREQFKSLSIIFECNDTFEVIE